MRTWTIAAIAAVLGAAAGWLLRGQPVERIRVVTLRPKAAPLAPRLPQTQLSVPVFPDLPKPPLETPVPSLESTEPTPSPLVGTFPALPAAGGPIGSGGGPTGPLMPEVGEKPPLADLKADEALARRVVLQSGGDVVSSDDAKDAMGKVGRMLVVETDFEGRAGLRSALRRALGDHAVLSDGGSSPGTSPAIQKAEEALELLRKGRDKARVDFLPEAPILQQMEEDYLAKEREVAAMRKKAARLRLTILLRPVLGA